MLHIGILAYLSLIVLLPATIFQLHLPLTTPLPGSELTKEPFRWDQRLFALVLRIPGNASVEPEPLGGVPSDDSPITPMCEVTGGRKQTEYWRMMCLSMFCYICSELLHQEALFRLSCGAVFFGGRKSQGYVCKNACCKLWNYE